MSVRVPWSYSFLVVKYNCWAVATRHKIKTDLLKQASSFGCCRTVRMLPANHLMYLSKKEGYQANRSFIMEKLERAHGICLAHGIQQEEPLGPLAA